MLGFFKDAVWHKKHWSYLVCGIRKLLQGLEHDKSYNDGLIVYTKDWDNHFHELDELSRWWQQVHLAVRPKRSLFVSKSIKFLGHLVSGNCIAINEENLEKIRLVKRPTTKKDMRLFLGLAKYSHNHMVVGWDDPKEKAFAALPENLLQIL